MDLIVDAWQGISQWWALLPLGLLFQYGLVRAGYQLWKEENQKWAEVGARLQAVEQERDGLKEENEALTEEKESQPPSSNGLPADALANRHLRGQPIHIGDLARSETMIRGWTFEDCTIYGPTIIATLGGTNIHKPTWVTEKAADVLYVADGDRKWEGVIGLQDCALRRCTFVRVGLLVKPEEFERIKGEMEGQDGT